MAATTAAPLAAMNVDASSAAWAQTWRPQPSGLTPSPSKAGSARGAPEAPGPPSEGLRG
eukprot:CAMPEP_0182895060 /NCGR_PEP_ID=MMETSP0034_2-20130328/25450_1 /TAXON_ID=156128 /ORGANISM="Nephroselmis pyriformis, Strain CCMP717" /LENGTH=58 /DNA_ID=CAMNT_0025028867 /DNA_START=617 /DNA_END=794 /DNA_ORIENTATION=-